MSFEKMKQQAMSVCRDALQFAVQTTVPDGITEIEIGNQVTPFKLVAEADFRTDRIELGVASTIPEILNLLAVSALGAIDDKASISLFANDEYCLPIDFSLECDGVEVGEGRFKSQEFIAACLGPQKPGTRLVIG